MPLSIASDLPPAATVTDIETTAGLARAHIYPVPHGVPRASIVLGHSAGAGLQSPELVAVAQDLPGFGIEVVLVEQPWLVAGRRVADPAAKLDSSWVQAVSALRRSGVGLRRLVVGGRSAGARVACRTVLSTKAEAVVAFAFPLRNPRNREASRAGELAAAAAVVPVTVIQGTRDAYGEPADVATSAAELGQRVLTIAVPFADHSFALSARATITGHEARIVIVEAARRVILHRRGNVGPLLAR